MLGRVPALVVGHLQGTRKFLTRAAHASAYVVMYSFITRTRDV